jgi:hypothetical protein
VCCGGGGRCCGWRRTWSARATKAAVACGFGGIGRGLLRPTVGVRGPPTLLDLSGTALKVPKKPGESCLKPAKTKTKHISYLNAHTGHDPRCGGPRSPPEWPSQRPPRAGSASLEGSRLPRAGSASLEGSPPPRSRLPHEHACSRMRVRAFNALTQQSRAITRLGITPRRCSANSLGETHPRHCRELCGMAGVSPAALCCPLPYG